MPTCPHAHTPTRQPNSGTTKHMDAIVIGFYNDKKKQASKFHEVTETMMNQLLFVASHQPRPDLGTPILDDRG